MAGKAIAGMALDAVGSVVNNLNNELQMERTFGYNERAAKNADARTRALFTDLYSPEAKAANIRFTFFENAATPWPALSFASKKSEESYLPCRLLTKVKTSS